MLAGSILAYYELNKENQIIKDEKILNYTKHRFYNFKKKIFLSIKEFSLFPVLGLLLIIFSLFFNNEKPVSNILILQAVLGTSLIIYFTNKKDFVTRMLSNKILVYFGLISYSLYLWHYPIFAFYRYQFAIGDGNSYINKILIIVILFFLSLISYYFIEKPFRNKITINNKKFFIYLISFFFAIFLFSINVLNKNGLSSFKASQIFSSANTNVNYKNERIFIESKFYDEEISSWLNKDNFDVNRKYLNNFTKKIVIAGNSHARDLYMIFKLGGDYFIDYDFLYLNNEELDNFINNKKNLNLYKTDFLKKANYIILSNFWVPSLDKGTVGLIDKLEDVIIKLKNNNNKNFEIILATHHSTPFFTIKRHNIFDYYLVMNKALPDREQLNKIEKDYFYYLISDPQITKTNYHLIQLSKKFNLKILNKTDILCEEDQRRCYLITPDGNKIYKDYDHFTISGGKFFSKKLSIVIKDLFN